MKLGATSCAHQSIWLNLEGIHHTVSFKPYACHLTRLRPVPRTSERRRQSSIPSKATDDHIIVTYSFEFRCLVIPQLDRLTRFDMHARRHAHKKLPHANEIRAQTPQPRRLAVAWQIDWLNFISKFRSAKSDPVRINIRGDSTSSVLYGQG